MFNLVDLRFSCNLPSSRLHLRIPDILHQLTVELVMLNVHLAQDQNQSLGDIFVRVCKQGS